jgi:cytidylate kinase
VKFTVAIDGPAAAGKGTISKAVAAHFGFAHLDTGLLYRAVGARVAEGEDPVSAARTLTGDDLARSDLRTQAVADAASTVATNQQVRQALVEFQRGFAAKEGGAVLDGRDIGTVICPDADAKLFVTARAEVRAERRWKELQAAGMEAEFDTVLAEVEARDARDAGRKDAPMRQAADAVLLDTSDLTIDEAIARAVAAIEKAGGRAGG